MDENPPQLKRGRPIGSKDTVSRKQRGKNQESTPEEPGVVLTSKELNALEEAQTHEKITNPRNTENSITYCNEIWDRNKIVIDEIFAFSVAHKIMDDVREPQSIIECRQRQDWPKWEEAIKDDNVNPLDINGYFFGNEMRKTRLSGIKIDTLPKDSPKDLGLIMMRHIHL